MGTNELAFVGLAGSGLGTALGVPMVWPRAHRSLDARLLGGAILLMSAITALISARLAGLAPATTAVEHAINLLGLCAFPILVLYTRHATDAPVSVRTTVWCLVPAAVYLVLIPARHALGAETRVPFAWMLPVILGFTAVSAITLWKGRDSRHSGLLPAQWIVGFVVIMNVAQIVRMTFSDVALVRGVVPMVLSIGFLAATTFLVWRTVASGPGGANRDGVPRYERSGLDQPAAEDVLRRIEAALTRERLFAQPELTLAQLAAATGSTPHQLSEVLNRYARVTFHDLINRRRVEDVKAQLRDPASDRFTIEGIGAAAGFGSRSALYAAFRRLEGTTPTAFRASLRRQT